MQNEAIFAEEVGMTEPILPQTHFPLAVASWAAGPTIVSIANGHWRYVTPGMATLLIFTSEANTIMVPSRSQLRSQASQTISKRWVWSFVFSMLRTQSSLRVRNSAGEANLMTNLIHQPPANGVTVVLPLGLATNLIDKGFWTPYFLGLNLPTLQIKCCWFDSIGHRIIAVCD